MYYCKIIIVISVLIAILFDVSCASPFETKNSFSPNIAILRIDSIDNNGCLKRAVPINQNKITKKAGEKSEFLHNFTVKDYFDIIINEKTKIPNLKNVLMYYWGMNPGKKVTAINMAVWAISDLKKLKALGINPAIGLETTDRNEIITMLNRLKDAGYDKDTLIYVRVCAEPENMRYLKQQSHSERLYRKVFIRVSRDICENAKKLGLSIRTIYCAAICGLETAFIKYLPPEDTFDVLGIDLYITPVNLKKVFQELEKILHHCKHQNWAIPEFGIATSGYYTDRNRGKIYASPKWGAETAQALRNFFSNHSEISIEHMAIFSVDAMGRIKNRRWGWIWSQEMIETLFSKK